ncbi:hypothetical protein AGDE_06551 [Angomonas deanei]|uniref:RF-1 domain containing protein, putative n=1 Tax=Angomonas deanei TaxID=59799 RepID=A0A7G2CDJ0_9TRYP|nr:hypothetical protein AGDE_06551 [Angomonas deanei]CAD2217908.1 RF-1 domain containing protein, putative [Angomonas deanei]|eukprot:EPY37383.1 hypothetical protein AGDE_06551 [Angomonas deanei]
MLRRLSLINTNQCALCLLMTTRFSGQRPNNKRYSMSNKKGRVAASKNNIATLKKLNKKNAKEFFDALPPRDKLDVLRVLHLKRTSRHAGHQSSKLPRYRSALFERWYIFKEEDVREESTLGRGPGGQATNRRMQTVILKHVPSDIIVKFSRFPSLHLNRRAARDLLNERLEEHLLGVDSVLGRRKMLRERRARRRKKVVEYLAKKGGKLNCHCLLKDVYDFHNGQGYLPPSVLREMGYDEGSRVDIKHLFECECKNIWPIIQSCYRTHPQSPELMCYLLPLPQEGDYANFEKCKTDKVLRQNVEKFLFILIEIFGCV